VSTPEPEPTEDTAAAGEPDSTRIAALETSLRRHRVWLAMLTAILGLFAISALALIGLVSYELGSAFEDTGVSDESAVEAKSEIQQAYGDRLDDVEVRAVKVKYEEMPFPYSLMGGDDAKSLYVQYRLKGSDVTVADIVEGGVLGEDVATSGMLPTKGSLTSRMTPEQLDRLLVAYANETNKPLGSVRRYGDSQYPMEPGVAVPDEVTVGNRAYASKELWAANEGRVVEGTEVDLSSESEMSRKALIFHEDPETGEFTFLGIEPSANYW